MNRSALEKFIMKAMANPAIEINGLTKDYPVGFWRKKMRRSLDHLNLQSGGRGIVRISGAERRGENHHDEAVDGLIFPTAGTARVRGRSIGDVRMHARSATCRSSPIFTIT